MKKFITPFIATFLLFCASFMAAQTVNFSMDNVTVDRGQQICIPIKVSGFTLIAGFQFSVSYDPSALQFDSVKNLNLPDLTKASSFGFPGVGNVPAGKMTVLWDEKTFAGLTLPNGTTIFEVCFTVLNTANSTRVDFANSPTSQDIFNASSQQLTFVGKNSDVTVNGSSAATPFKLTASNKTVTQGTQVCVDITAQGFDTISMMKFTLQYDTTKLTYASVQGFNLPGLTAASFGLPGTGGIPKGKITVNWTNSPANQGITKASGAVLFQVCFTTPATGTANVSFTDTPQAQVVTKASGAAVTFSSQAGTVTINGAGGGSDVFKLIVGNATGASGTNVCLDVTAQGFKSIVSMSFSIQYDQTKLQYVSTGSYNLTGLNAQSFGTPGTGGVPVGRLTSVWDDPSTQGLTIPDGTVIFQVCFKILATSGSTPVSMVGNPTTLEVLKIINGTLQQGMFSSQAGTVTVGTTGGGSTDFTLSLSDKTVAPGQQVCLDVSVKNFKKLVGMQFSLGYDPTKLQFVSISSLNLQYLTLGKIGTPTGGQPTPAGQISVIWEDETVQGLNVPDNTIIFQVCFNAVGSNGTTTVSFTSTPTDIEISDTSFAAIPYVTKNGVVTIGTGTGCVAPTLAPPSITQVSCFGQSTGAINITPQGGSGNFTYNWSNGAVTQDLTNIPAGPYSVTVTDATCSLTISATYNINQPTSAISVISQITPIECGAAPNSGSIVLSVAGGTSPYTYKWSGSLPATVNQSNLAPGTYSVTVTDNKGCTFAVANLNVVSESTVAVSLVPTNINQQGNGGAVANTVSGGSGTFTYAWSGPGGFTSTQKNLSNLTTPGQYCVTVTDSEGCTAMQCTNITAPLVVRGQTNRVCDGSTNGSIILTVTGGATPYTFRWSNNATTQNLTNVAAGSYTVTITDNQGATNTSNFEISKYPVIVVNAQITSTSTVAGNGRIALTISGGTAPYTIHWQNNNTNDTLFNLAAGQYCVTITDDKGCTKNDCYTVALENIPLAIANIQMTGVTCNGDKNGTLSFQINGGRAPYSIAFSDNTTLQSNNGAVSKTNIGGGTLSFTVTDQAGATLTSSVNIPQPVAIQTNTIAVIHDVEDPGCTGSIALTFKGGTAPYTVQWNSPNTGAQIINLCAGNFVPTVRDANGCTQVLPAIEVTTFRASGAAIATLCPQDTNGMIALTIAGGTKPYGYSWTNTAGTVIATSDTLRNIAPGVYTARITEQSGNILTKQFTVGSTSNLNADVEVISDYNGADISCRTSTDGIIEATGKSGSGTYTYEWRRGTTVLSDMPVLNGVGAGIYQVAVKDNLGCTVTKQVEVVAPDSIQILANIREISCVGKTDGEIIVTTTGGLPGKPYTFGWSTNGTGPRVSFLAPGTYTVTATDVNNCKVSSSFTLDAPKPIQIQVETQPATDDCNGVAIAKVEGGTAPYTYLWNAPNGNGAMIENLCAGTYSVMVTDSRGCAGGTASSYVEDKANPCFQAQPVITPEGDGLNERLIITCSEGNNNHLEIYNRWGQLVYQADNYDNQWEGTTQSGDALPDGPYYFVLEYTDTDGTKAQKKGSFTILRGR